MHAATRLPWVIIRKNKWNEKLHDTLVTGHNTSRSHVYVSSSGKQKLHDTLDTVQISLSHVPFKVLSTVYVNTADIDSLKQLPQCQFWGGVTLSPVQTPSVLCLSVSILRVTIMDSLKSPAGPWWLESGKNKSLASGHVTRDKHGHLLTMGGDIEPECPGLVPGQCHIVCLVVKCLRSIQCTLGVYTAV